MQRARPRRALRLAAHLLLGALLGLAAAGCTAADLAYLRYRSHMILVDYHQALHEHTARQRTTDRLLANYRVCLAAGEIEALCWAGLAAYRDCLEAGSRDAVCQKVAP